MILTNVAVMCYFFSFPALIFYFLVRPTLSTEHRYAHTHVRIVTRPNFFQSSSHIALVYQSCCSRTTANQFYSDWMVVKNLDGYCWTSKRPVSFFQMFIGKIDNSYKYEAVEGI